MRSFGLRGWVRQGKVGRLFAEGRFLCKLLDTTQNAQQMM